MALDTYAHLQTSILDVLMRPELTASVADWITLFEAEARRRLNTYWQEATATFATVANTATVALPGDFGSLRQIRFDTSPIVVPDFLTPEQLYTIYTSGTAGQPKAYAIRGTSLVFAPTPDGIYNGTIDYHQGLPALSANNTTNWLLTDHPDAYLFGSLAEAELYIGDDSRFPLWLQRREAAFDSIMRADINARFPAGLRMQTDTGNP